MRYNLIKKKVEYSMNLLDKHPENRENIIDLRSDTITKPSPEMWEAVRGIGNDDVGDDVYFEDPTVLELERKAAKLVGKEAALYVVSGTMGNLVSTLTNTHPGDQILIEEMSHMALDEVGGAGRLAGVLTRTYLSDNGVPDFNLLENRTFDGSDIHQPPTTMIAFEDTHNFHGGIIIPPEVLKEAREFADRHSLKLHLDGARIFNAAVASGRDVKDFTKFADSVMFCLSKGLAAPIGSIIAGSEEFIGRALKFRKMVGGGWRQAGIIAAMGLVALEPKWIARLEEDHKNAKRLAEGLRAIASDIKIIEPQTNILIFDLPEGKNPEKFISELSNRGVLAFRLFGQTVRFVTHYGIDKDDIEKALKIISDVYLSL